MPTYNNPISFGSGFKLAQAVPVDDRMIFDDVNDADTYLSITQYNVYEGLWAFLIDPGDYYMCQRTDIGIPQDDVTNPYIWKRFSGTLGALPAIGEKDQQLVMDPNGVAPVYDYANQKGLSKVIGAMINNPGLTVGMYVRQLSPTVFEDFHTVTNYPLNNFSDLPLYCVFRIVGDDIWVGRQGIIVSTNHNVAERVPLYLRTQYQTGSTYFDDLLTNIATTVIGELVSPAGHAIDANNIYVDLTRNTREVEAGGGVIGNATIQRDLIQYSGSGGIPVDLDGFFTIPHGFGDQRGIVQVVALNSSPPPYPLGSGDVKVTADVIAFETGAVRIKLDYGAVDQSLVFEVVMVF